MLAQEKTAAATSVPVHLEEMAKVINRGFRALKPRQIVSQRNGEILFILEPDIDQPQFIIKVQSSIMRGETVARESAEDSIRIVLLNKETDRPITGKFQRVHRTQNWKDNLRSRIEDAVEEFDDMNTPRQQQLMMLDDLVAARIHPAFVGMLQTLREARFFTLTEKQAAWVESAHSRLR